MRNDPAADAKSVPGDNTISGPSHDARITSQNGRYGLQVQIFFFFVKKGQSLGWSYRYVTEVSARSDESMYRETVTLPNASSGTERMVEETTLATRSTRAARSSGDRTTASSHRLIQKSCSRCKNLVFSQSEALEGFHASTDDIVNNKCIPSEESSNERSFNGINAGMIPMADSVWKHFPCVDNTSGRFAFDFNVNGQRMKTFTSSS